VVLSKTATTAGLSVKGWAIDRVDVTRSIGINVGVTSPDGATKTYPFTASQPRTDVNTALGVSGSHGFAATIPVTAPGGYKVCSYAVALSPLAAENPLLGCKSIDVAAIPAPVGSLDIVAVNKSSTTTSLNAGGWALDWADAARSITVHIEVTSPDGTAKTYPLSASQARSDVNTVLGVSGSHGYSTSVQVSSPRLH
jgi:hypothetical protein